VGIVLYYLSFIHDTLDSTSIDQGYMTYDEPSKWSNKEERTEIAPLLFLLLAVVRVNSG